MYKVLLFAIAMCTSIMLNAQSVSNDVSIPVQQGTVSVVNGQATVSFTPDVKERLNGTSYYVFLTAVGSPMLLSLDEKTHQSFTIRATPSTGFAVNGTADYIVFITQAFQQANTALAPGQQPAQPTRSGPPVNSNNK